MKAINGMKNTYEREVQGVEEERNVSTMEEMLPTKEDKNGGEYNSRRRIFKSIEKEEVKKTNQIK